MAVVPIYSGKLSIFPNNNSCGFIIQDLLSDGPISFVLTRKETRLMFPDWTGFVGRLTDQDAAYRFFSAEGGDYRFCITKQMLPQIEVVTSNLEWLLKIILHEDGYFLACFGQVDNVQLMRFDMQKFKAPEEMKGKKLVILSEGYQ